MSLKNDIMERQKTAMKEKDAKTLSVMRMLMTEVKNAEIDSRGELSNEDVVAIVKRQVKQLKDARKDIVAGGREDMAAEIDAEVDILSSYLPAELSEEELLTIIQQVINDTGAKDKAHVGQVMGAAMKAVAGRADGARVREMAMKLLG